MYQTIYTYTRTPRKGIFKGTKVTKGHVYTTKSLTPFHKTIRDNYPDAQTWKDAERVITNFVPGMNLRMLPIVRGGERIA